MPAAISSSKSFTFITHFSFYSIKNQSNNTLIAQIAKGTGRSFRQRWRSLVDGHQVGFLEDPPFETGLKVNKQPSLDYTTSSCNMFLRCLLCNTARLSFNDGLEEILRGHVELPSVLGRGELDEPAFPRRQSGQSSCTSHFLIFLLLICILCSRKENIRSHSQLHSQVA